MKNDSQSAGRIKPSPDNYIACIEQAWDSKTLACHWLDLETVLVSILSDGISDSARVALCKQAIDAFTKRGHFTPDEYTQNEVL